MTLSPKQERVIILMREGDKLDSLGHINNIRIYKKTLNRMEIAGLIEFDVNNMRYYITELGKNIEL